MEQHFTSAEISIGLLIYVIPTLVILMVAAFLADLLGPK